MSCSRVSRSVSAGLLAGVFLVSACATQGPTPAEPPPPFARVQPPRAAPPPPPPPPPRHVPETGLEVASAAASFPPSNAAPGGGLVGRPDAPPSDFNTEEYGVIDEPGFVTVTAAPLSTFSIDVDTAAYANVRRFLRDGSMPPADAVRIEELINYFDYDYPHPEAGEPFGIVTEIAGAPWAPAHQLVHIGLRSTPVATGDLPPNNLVFLLDVSGSMNGRDKLPLLKEAFAVFVEQLRPQDRVAIVVYAGAAGMVLPPTSGAEKAAILDTLSRLEAGGSTAGGAGIRLAYELAREHFMEAGNNRVILATDGDFNVGVSSDGELVALIEGERRSGVYLSVLGFGTGNLQDAKMEQLADHGNGNYAYIDGRLEARRVLVEQMGATLLTVANDVKLQVEFNPAQVEGYRLIGYENRRLRDEEFNDDTRDAGDLGAGHSVTALYEIVPAGSDEPVPGGDPLRYQQIAPRPGVDTDEVLTVKVRYKRPDESESRLLARTLTRPPADDVGPSDAFRFASAVAEFGLLLRDSPYKGDASYERAYERAREALGDDEDGRRSELLSLIRTAENPVAMLLSLDTVEPGEPRSVPVGHGERVRFRLAGLQDGTYTIDAIAGSDGFDPVLHLYRQAGNQLVTIATDDDGGAKRLDSRINARLTGAESYFIGLEEYSGLSGSVTLSINRRSETR